MKERDVETAYIEWLQSKRKYTVLGRQVRLPLGTLDVLSVSVNEIGCQPIVSEIKLGKVDDKALTQVMGYASQVDALISQNVCVLDGDHEYYNPTDCTSILVGTEMTPMVRRVHHAFGVAFTQYVVNHGGIEFSDDHGAGIYGDDTTIAGPLAALAEITTLWRTLHRRDAAALSSRKNYERQLNSRIARSYTGLEDTVAYWTRKLPPVSDVEIGGGE